MESCLCYHPMLIRLFNHFKINRLHSNQLDLKERIIKLSKNHNWLQNKHFIFIIFLLQWMLSLNIFDIIVVTSALDFHRRTIIVVFIYSIQNHHNFLLIKAKQHLFYIICCWKFQPGIACTVDFPGALIWFVDERFGVIIMSWGDAVPSMTSFWRVSWL